MRSGFAVSKPTPLSESLQLVLAALLASIAVAGSSAFSIPWNPLGYASGVLAGSLVGYVAHEYAHRRAAERVGCTAYFTLWVPGLAVTAVFAALRVMGLGFALILPGYVRVFCPFYGGSMASISAWGPAANIVLAYVGLAAYWLGAPLFAAGFSAVNAWIAVMNLLPIPPLDGYELSRSRPSLWLLLAAVSGLALYFSWQL